MAVTLIIRKGLLWFLWQRTIILVMGEEVKPYPLAWIIVTGYSHFVSRATTEKKDRLLEKLRSGVNFCLIRESAGSFWFFSYVKHIDVRLTIRIRFKLKQEMLIRLAQNEGKHWLEFHNMASVLSKKWGLVSDVNLSLPIRYLVN